MNLRMAGFCASRVWMAAAAISFVIVAAGCQADLPVETKLPANPSEQPTVESVVLTYPSQGVDAGRLAGDPFDPTHKKQIITPPNSGLDVYLKSCTGCHSQTGKPLQSNAPDLSDPVFCWTKTPQEFFKDLVDPSNPNHKGNTLVGQLDRQQLWNAVFYTWTLHSSTNDVVQGGITYGRYCGVCHGTKGLGDGNLAVDLNPSPRRFTDFVWMVDKTDQRLYISISDGRPPSAMPAWKAQLTPTQRIQIVNYLRAFSYSYPENLQKKMAEQPPA